MSKKSRYGGRIALSGYIFQTLYAIILSMDEEWDWLKVEPVNPDIKLDTVAFKDVKCDGVDIQLLGNNGLYKNIQVKKRTRPVSQNELDDWCKQLIDDARVDKDEICLFGTLKDGVVVDQRVSLKIFRNDVDKTELMVKQKIAEYCERQDAADYSPKDIDDAYKSLFMLLMMNSIEDKPVGREDVEKKLSDILQFSPENKAALIKLNSDRIFHENPDYIRDLEPARLDSTGKKIINDQRLSSSELPCVKIGENKPVNLEDYFAGHVKDNSVTRHIYLSAKSGSGKSTCIYDLWEKNLADDNKFIPIYVPLSEVVGTIKEYIRIKYLSPAYIDDFEWLDRDFKKSSYHIILFLDGYNELTGNDNNKLDSEIGELFDMERVTVLVSSRDPKKKFGEKNITRLIVCPLSKEQISNLLGGNKEILAKKRYEGVLTNPFMLEICIKAYAGGISEKITSINQISMESILQEYFRNQIKGKNLSRIYINVVLPLVAMRLDQQENKVKIVSDTIKYGWKDFDRQVQAVQKSINVYKQSVVFCIGDDPENIDYIDTIRNTNNLPSFLIKVGKKLEIFGNETIAGRFVKWDHEIYRDYFVARGYALYAAAHKDSENCIYNLAKQVNYRFEEPENAVSEELRGYHVQKAQMFIDMVDARLDDHAEFGEEDFERLKKTATYRRLIRDVAFIYEDLTDINMGAATDLCMKYYTNNLKTYDRSSKHDYDSKMRRYADAAYSLSGLAFNYTHIKPVGDDDNKQLEYLNKAKNALELSDSLFKELDSDIKKNPTVRDDMVKYNGNCAALNLAMARIEIDKEKKDTYINNALQAHKNNLKIRLEIRKEFRKSKSDDIDNNMKLRKSKSDVIDNNIAVSYVGIATCYYYLGDYHNAVKYNSKSIDERPVNKKPQNASIYGRIVGCYAEMKEYTSDDVVQAISWIVKALNYVYDNDMLQIYDDLGNKIISIKENMSEEQKEAHSTDLTNIENIMISISNKSYNS